MPESATERTLDNILGRVFDVGSIPEMIDLLKVMLKEAGDILNQTVRQINPMELWYHGLEPSLITKIVFDIFYRTKLAEFFLSKISQSGT